MPVESYSLIYKHHKGGGIAFTLKGDDKWIWFPKSALDKIEDNDLDYETLIRDEQVDVYIPDWLAEDKGLL